jgi:hypothetical protein|tara:strand:- start:4522 stop:4713 length:192 start_codon:yes stop_codon:yes gene_type:complete
MKYTIRQEDKFRFVIYKNEKPLLLPCKLTKLKKVEFDNRLEAEKYISDVQKLCNSGKEYMEIY